MEKNLLWNQVGGDAVNVAEFHEAQIDCLKNSCIAYCIAYISITENLL